jgi:hypothetical protein
MAKREVKVGFVRILSRPIPAEWRIRGARRKRHMTNYSASKPLAAENCGSVKHYV